jgi:hypothetical protein
VKRTQKLAEFCPVFIIRKNGKEERVLGKPEARTRVFLPDLARVNNLLLEATNELGKWRVIVEKLKHTKNTLIEQNRALKEILKAERF